MKDPFANAHLHNCETTSEVAHYLGICHIRSLCNTSLLIMQSPWLSNMTQDVLLRGSTISSNDYIQVSNTYIGVLTYYFIFTLYLSLMCASLKGLMYPAKLAYMLGSLSKIDLKPRNIFIKLILLSIIYYYLSLLL